MFSIIVSRVPVISWLAISAFAACCAAAKPTSTLVYILSLSSAESFNCQGARTKNNDQSSLAVNGIFARWQRRIDGLTNTICPQIILSLGWGPKPHLTQCVIGSDQCVCPISCSLNTDGWTDLTNNTHNAAYRTTA